MADDIHIFAMAGSLRRGSYNASALKACVELGPEGMSFDIYDGLRDLPHYDDDLYVAGAPASVADLRVRITRADAIIIACPEYNHSVPGVLKNAIDWASRPPEVPLKRKPTAFMGASRGMMGTIRAQYHLRDMFIYFDAPVVNALEVFIGAAHTKFAADGALTDEPTKAILRAMLEALRQVVLRHRAALAMEAQS